MIVAAIILAATGPASAHTITIGYENAGPGSVTFWYGTYHSFAAPFTEGSFNLVGVAPNTYPSTTVSFTLSVGTKPAGLVDGTTNFYACNPNNLCSSNVSGFPGPAVKWQGVTFTGLAAGQYQFTYIPQAVPTADWAPINTAVQTSNVTLSGAVVGAAPAEIPTLSVWAMVGLSLLLAVGAVVAMRRQRR
jgi:hypothetical protein